MGSKSWVGLSVLAFALATLVGCNNTEKNKTVGGDSWRQPQPMAKGGAPQIQQGPQFPGGLNQNTQPFPRSNTGGLPTTGLNPQQNTFQPTGLQGGLPPTGGQPFQQGNIPNGGNVIPRPDPFQNPNSPAIPNGLGASPFPQGQLPVQPRSLGN